MTAIHRGKSIKALSKDLSERAKIGYNKAETLVRTELNHAFNRAALDSMQSAGLDHYKFVATFDHRTCPRCGGVDGLVFEVTESMPGENYPPMHPRCRCTVVPSLGEVVGKRTSKVDGKRVKVPADMTYTEWRKIYIDNGKSVIVSGYSENLPFKKIRGTHTAGEDLKAVNPNYGKGYEWSHNCQRCVPTYELRRRGYDVTAKPIPGNDRLSWIQDSLSKQGNYLKMFENPQPIRCEGNGLKDIIDNMKKWGNGARGEIYVVWRNSSSGHVFAAENKEGKIIFVDPQNSSATDKNILEYFQRVKEGFVFIHRMDTLKFNRLIKECCTEVKTK